MMKSRSQFGRVRPYRRAVLLAVAFLTIGLTRGTAYAGKKADIKQYIDEKGEHVVRVEEHWKIRVAYPDPRRDLPQFNFVLTPLHHFDGPHMVLSLNHHTDPRFAPGGVQLQAYEGPNLLGVHSKLHGQRLWETDDDIEVRMAISIEDGSLHYRVLKVKGKSWGDNKGDHWLHLSSPTRIRNLDNYEANLTHEWTGAGAGVHTLEKVEVTKVRYTFSDGKDIDVDEYKTKIEYQPSVTYRSYDEYKASLEAYKE